MQDHGPGQPRWRIALWTLLVEAVCLATVLALPGFLLLLGSSGCMSPGFSDQTEPQMYDPAEWVGGLVLACVLMVSAVMALRLLFAGERGDHGRVRWLRVQLLVQLGLVVTIVTLVLLLRAQHGIDHCYPRR